MAVGLAILELLRSVDGNQRYVPPPLAVSVTLSPDVILVEDDVALAVGPDVCVTETVCVCVQPFESVTVTVYVPTDSPVAVWVV